MSYAEKPRFSNLLQSFQHFCFLIDYGFRNNNFLIGRSFVPKARAVIEEFKQFNSKKACELQKQLETRSPF
jgi:hypothetical protein